MMRIVQINTTCGVGSTGKIAIAISELLTQHGVENSILFSSATNGYELGIQCGKSWYTKIQALKSRLLGNYGFNSLQETKKIIAKLDEFSPDTVLLHNIHGHDCNLEMLFSYFRKKQTKLIWVFHDCWAFTGYCTHFMFDCCDRWKNECNQCPQKNQYSWFFDRSCTLYNRKKQLLSGLDMTIITPSQWLADLVKQSFLKNYPVKVIHNGIDLTVFRPTPSDFRERYLISKDAFLLLGVAFGWGMRKGLDVFIDLSQKLDTKKFQIVLVGTDDEVDKVLPKNIISIHRTQNQKELAEIYTEADLFVNPTREDNYPTVNMESIACGTPVITFRTGGSPEIVREGSGVVVDYNDIDALERGIKYIAQKKPFKSDVCCEYGKQFDKNLCFQEYLNLLIGE